MEPWAALKGIRLDDRTIERRRPWRCGTGDVLQQNIVELRVVKSAAVQKEPSSES